jgi:hypothetical protein
MKKRMMRMMKTTVRLLKSTSKPSVSLLCHCSEGYDMKRARDGLVDLGRVLTLRSMMFRAVSASPIMCVTVIDCGAYMTSFPESVEQSNFPHESTFLAMKA